MSVSTRIYPETSTSRCKKPSWLTVDGRVSGKELDGNSVLKELAGSVVCGSESCLIVLLGRELQGVVVFGLRILGAS